MSKRGFETEKEVGRSSFRIHILLLLIISLSSGVLGTLDVALSDELNDSVTSGLGKKMDTSDQRYLVLKQRCITSESKPLLMSGNASLWSEDLYTRCDKSSSCIADPGCGDGRWEEGNEYACPRDFRNPKRSFLPVPLSSVICVCEYRGLGAENE